MMTIVRAVIARPNSKMARLGITGPNGMKDRGSVTKAAPTQASATKFTKKAGASGTQDAASEAINLDDILVRHLNPRDHMLSRKAKLGPSSNPWIGRPNTICMVKMSVIKATKTLAPGMMVRG